MHDADALENINREQLATATDRLLLRGGRASKRRPSTRSFAPSARGSMPELPHGPLARGSQPQIAFPALPAYDGTVRGSQPQIAFPARASQSFTALPMPEPGERTIVARRGASVHTQVFAVLVAVPTLVGVAIGIAALL